MKSGRKAYLLVFGCLMLLSLRAFANNPVLLPDTSFDYSITPYVSVLEDATGELDITTVLTREQQLRFTPSHAQALKFGITDSAYWLRFSLSNPYGHERRVVLTLSGNELDTIDFYDISAGDSYLNIRQEDQARALRGGFLQTHPVELTIPAQSTRSFLIRIHANGILSTDLHLLSLDRFLSNEQRMFTIQGVSMGWILATLAWFIFIFKRRRLLFAAASAGYCLTVAIYQPAWMGVLPLLTDLSPSAANLIGEIALALSVVFHTLAARQLEWQDRYAALLKRWLLILALIHIPVLAITLIFFTPAAMLIVASEVAINLFLLALAMALGRSAYPVAQRRVLIGAVVVGFGVLIAVLSTYNFLSLDTFTAWAPLTLPFVIIGSLVMATMECLKEPIEERRKQSQPGLPLSLLSQISHELRTPINGVIGMNELLSDTPLSAAQREFSETITLAGRDLLHIANEISDLARLRNRTLELEKRPFNLSMVLTQVMAHFQQEATRKQVELVMDIADDLPEQFRGDSSRLQTMLHNLVSHALAYTEYGELALHASPYADNIASGVRIQLQLSNTLVKPEELKHAFRILQQKNTTPTSDGDPWNLLLTRQLIELTGSQLAVESMTGQGASLTLCVPMSATYTERTMPRDESLIGLRILVVDDNASLRSVIEKQVRRWGMRPESTYSGKEALAMLRNQINIGQPFDVIVIDHDMPVMNGLQLAERIENDADITPKPARLMLTGLSTSAVADDARQVGIQQVIAKPASGERLRQALLELRYRRPADDVDD